MGGGVVGEADGVGDGVTTRSGQGRSPSFPQEWPYQYTFPPRQPAVHPYPVCLRRLQTSCPSASVRKRGSTSGGQASPMHSHTDAPFPARSFQSGLHVQPRVLKISGPLGAGEAEGETMGLKWRGHDGAAGARAPPPKKDSPPPPPEPEPEPWEAEEESWEEEEEGS
jgi:hypothetical protein